MSDAVVLPHSQAAFSYDMFSDEVLANPIPFYEVLRRDHPIYYSEKYDTYFLSRFADIQEFLNSNDGTFISSEGTVPPADLLVRHNDPAAVHEAPTDPHLAPFNYIASPTYDTLRQVHTKVYRPNSARAFESVMREVARERLDLLLPRGRFDVVQEYGGIVAASVTCELFGVPRSEAKDVLDTVNDAMGSVGKSDDDLKEVFDKLTGFIKPTVRRRRREGADGSFSLIDGLINYRLGARDVRRDANGEVIEGERELSDQEIAEVLSQVFAGGTETVPKTVGHGLWELMKRPEQMAAVREDLEVNVPLVVEEIFRFCSPAQAFFRTVHKPTRLLGVDLKVGQRVAWLPASAARDEAQYGDDAAEFKWDRDPKRLLAFGHGKSFCAGVHLARLEARVLVEEFLRRVPEFEVHEDRAVRPPSTFQWGWIKIPIIVPIAEAD